MSVFVDTSALLAIFDADDDNHEAGAARWRTLLETDETLVTTNYILIETVALFQRRLGMDAVRLFDRDVAPLLDVIWIDEARHRTSMAALVTAGRRDLSLVDCVSFESMRRAVLTQAFAFDRHFDEQGFELLG